MGLGLTQARKSTEGEAFPERLDAFLSSTRTADAVELARGLKFDLRDPDFWLGTLADLRSHVERHVALTNGLTKPG